MKLKRLILQGYKTFAGKTEFVFDDGITAIVGPNGSGKSNIADALRWVLGEQSYGTLRGKRTTDMIFAGSQGRARAGMAQAILTLDNSDGWLPIDYTEVEIGRRAYRSGENEYTLNGQKVRLKDVLDLLATSGLAERTYTIIGQGLIDRALSLRAEERRALFEEAAGINHYKNRRAETLRRLEETQRNLARVHDILAEIRPRLGSLKRQATRAQNYEQLAADLRHLLRLWYGYKWEQAKRELRQARQTAETAEAAWNNARQKLLVQQANAGDLRQRINRLQQQAAAVQTSRDEAREVLERTQREIAILQERQQAIQRQLAEVEAELPLLEAQWQTAAAEVEAATAELVAAQASLQESQAQLQQFNATFQAQQQAINQGQQRLRQAEEGRRQSQTRLAQAEGQLSQLRERLREREAEEEESTTGEAAEMAQTQGDIEQLTARLAVAQGNADELRQKRQALLTERQEIIHDLRQLRQAAAGQETALNRQRQAVARLEARVELLAQIRQPETPEGADGQPNVPLIGRLASLITIPAPYQRAIAAALAARLAALVVPDEASLWQLVQGNGRPPQSTIIAALTDVQPPPMPPPPEDAAVIGWASDVIGCEEAARPVAQLLLGPVLLVQTAADAYRLARQLPMGAAAVAPDGFIAHAGGLVETAGGEAADNALAREAEWRQGKDELGRMKDELREGEARLAELHGEVQRRQSQADRLQQEERRLGRLEHEAGQRLAQAQRELDRAGQQQAFLARQQEALARRQAARAQEIGRLQARIAETEAAIEAHRAAVAAAETAVSEARAGLDALPVAEAQQQRQGLRQALDAAQTIVAGRQAVVDSRRATLAQLEKQVARFKERAASLRKQQAQLALADEETARTQQQARLAQLEEELRPLRARLDEARRELMGLEEETAASQKRAHELETQYTQAKIRLTQRENQVEGLVERIKADLGLVALSYDEEQTGPTPLPIGDLVERLPAVTELPGDIEESIHHARGQMQRLGAINPDAPAEYEATQARYDFLTGQIEDLNQTEGQLRRVIGELDQLTSDAFAATVTKVNDAFGETFAQLFGGGSAQLALTDPDDLTVSGVDIIARLPGRREQGLGLLSGGERSLTAAALIFALLKVSPTPFCVMDEVDAALDEANINRFRDLLRDLSRQTQFIVITHNRGTVQAAQTIYGISMGADSASQAISIRPEVYVKEGV